MDQQTRLQLMRMDLVSLQGIEPSNLPKVEYDDESQGWTEFWKEAMEAVGSQDVRTLLSMLRADVKMHQARHQEPTPEHIAAFYVLLHGKEKALNKYVQPWWDRGLCPDSHVAYLLLHPDIIPLNFPMYRRAIEP